MTTKQMDEMDDRRRLHALLIHDAWAALGLDARTLNDYYGRDGVTPADLWAQILAALRGNFVSLEADTNPPAPVELIDVARRRHDEHLAFDRLREMFGLDGASGSAVCDAIEKYDHNVQTTIQHLEGEFERLAEELAAARAHDAGSGYHNGRRPQHGDKVISAHGTTKYIAVIDAATNKVGYLGYWASQGAVTDLLPDGTVVVFREEVGFREDVGHRYCVAAKHLLVQGDS